MYFRPRTQVNTLLSVVKCKGGVPAMHRSCVSRLVCIEPLVCHLSPIEHDVIMCIHHHCACFSFSGGLHASGQIWKPQLTWLKRCFLICSNRFAAYSYILSPRGKPVFALDGWWLLLIATLASFHGHMEIYIRHCSNAESNFMTWRHYVLWCVHNPDNGLSPPPENLCCRYDSL